MLPIRIKAYTKAELEAIANPVLANQPEALIWTYYDTQSAVSGLTQLTFFSAVQANIANGNLEIAGTIAAPKYFQVWSVGFDVQADIANIAAVDQSGPLRDIQRLTMQAGGALQVVVSQKTYIQVPVSFLHASGGTYGFGVATLAASNGVQWGTNGPNDGGYYQAGALVLPPQQPFQAAITYPAAVTLFATTNTKLWMYGVLFRKVL